MPIRNNNTSGDYRALLASFDAVFSASIAEKCVNLSDQEILAILSQSEYLKWRTRWYKGEYSQDFDESEIDAIQALAASIQDKLINGLDDCIDCQAGDCIEYAPNASIIEWSPSTPGDVNDIPDGYRENPWYIIDQSIIGGYVRGDVLCDANTTLPQYVWDYLSIIFTSGTPRFRVNVTGRGQVELHLLRLAFGGIALVWQDDDYTTADVVDLQSYSLADIAPGTVDLLTFIDNAIDGDFSDVLIHERYFDTVGDHHIDVSFLPILDANISQLGWGGGLRKVVLCGFDENMAPIPQFRIVDNGNGCRDFQYKYDDQNELAWVTLTTICDGDDGAPGADGQDGAPGIDGQDCDCNQTESEDFVDDTDGIKPTGLNKRCDMASYLVDIPLPSVFADTLQAYNDAVDNNEFMVLLSIVGAAALTIATAGTAALAYSAAVLSGAALGVTIYDTVLTIDTALATTEADSQFWQDVKCTIYCNLPNDAILDQQAANDIADAIDSDLTTTYPNAAPVIASMFRSFSSETRGKYNVYGALYDGDNCDLCACGGWVAYVRGYPYVSKYINLLGTTTKWPDGGVFYDGAWTDRDSLVQVEIDLTDTLAYITGISIQGASYKDSGDSGDRYVKLEVWDEANKNYVTVWSAPASTAGADSFRNLNGGTPGVPYPLLTTKIRITQEGWGENQGMSWDNNYISVINVYGGGPDVFQIENDEYNGV